MSSDLSLEKKWARFEEPGNEVPSPLSPSGKPRKSRKCKFTKELNKLKSKICYINSTQENTEKIIEINKERAILKLTDNQLNQFNRINELIGREPFDRDEYVKEMYNVEPDNI